MFIKLHLILLKKHIHIISYIQKYSKKIKRLEEIKCKLENNFNIKMMKKHIIKNLNCDDNMIMYNNKN